MTTDDSAPGSPSDGDLWYDTDDGGMFVYYQDTDSSQWVEVIGSQGAPGAAGSSSYANFAAFPGSPTEGDIAYAQDTNALYVYNGTAWNRIDNGDESPVITTEPATTHTLTKNGSTSTVTMVAQDPEGFDITYGIAYKTANNTRPAQLASDPSINQTTGVYTFTPSTTAGDAGNFRARLSASDGAKTTTRFVDFSLAFTVDVEYLVIGGGGGGAGGTAGGGGGGAGGYRTATGYALTPGTAYSITVGAGGTGNPTSDGVSAASTDGGDSVFGSITAVGGGGGQGGEPSSPYAGNGRPGGSGGGGRYGGTGGAGTSGQGNAGGGSTSAGSRGGGGGGGAGGAGADGTSTTGGVGGAGLSSSITGTAVVRASGGSGGNTGSNTVAATAGGGGAGGTAVSSTAGAANTGGGGGGCGNGNGTPAGENGGSGVVIIAAQEAAATVTGTYTLDTSGRSGWYVYTFTAGTGSITF